VSDLQEYEDIVLGQYDAPQSAQKVRLANARPALKRDIGRRVASLQCSEEALYFVECLTMYPFYVNHIITPNVPRLVDWRKRDRADGLDFPHSDYPPIPC
jgi:hypothetical protein